MMTFEPTVFVVDDDEAVCRALRLLIKSAGMKAQTYSSAEQFLDAYKPSRPGCLLLDIQMPGMNGLALQEQLAQRKLKIPVIIITGHGDVPMAVRAMKLGAVDFIEKPFRDQALLDHIKRAIDQDAQDRHDQAELDQIKQRLGLLSRRERQVMDLVVTGKLNKVIAYELGITQKTVEFHRANVMRKMRVKSLAELVRLAVKAGAPESPPTEK